MADVKNTSTIDFSKLSQIELLAALGRINPGKFPANYEACKMEIERRKADGLWTQASSPVSESVLASVPAKRALFSVKRRYFSYLIDGLFVVVISLGFTPFSGFLNQIGLWGVLPFWFLNFAYATLLDGSIGQGQTIGKKFTNLKVVGEKGAILSWSQASMRGAYLAILVGMRIGMYGFFPDSIYANFFDFILFAFSAFDLLFVLKHSQNRSLLDLLSNTLVHDTDYPTPEFIGFSAVKNFKAWVAGVAIFVVAFFGFGLFFNQLPSEISSEAYRAEVESNTNLKYAGIGTYTNYKSGQLRDYGTNYTFWLSPEYLSDQKVVQEQSNKVREILAVKVPSNVESGTVNVIIVGHVFIGLLPVNKVYRNFDLTK